MRRDESYTAHVPLIAKPHCTVPYLTSKNRARPTKATADNLEIATGLGLGALLEDGLLDAAALGHGDLGLVGGSDDEDVAQPGGEGVALGVLDGDDVKGSLVALDVLEGTDAAGVAALGEHDHGAELEGEDVGHLAGGDVDLDGVVDLDVGVGVADGPAVVGDADGNLLPGDEDLVDAAELVRGLLLVDPVEDEAALGVEEEAEAVSRLLELDDVHEAGGVVEVGPDLAVDLDAALHADLHALLAGQGVLEPVAEDDGDGEALAHLVGAGAGAGGPDAGHLAEVPVAGRIEALEMLLGTASPEYFVSCFSGGIRMIVLFIPSEVKRWFRTMIVAVTHQQQHQHRFNR